MVQSTEVSQAAKVKWETEKRHGQTRSDIEEQLVRHASLSVLTYRRTTLPMWLSKHSCSSHTSTGRQIQLPRSPRDVKDLGRTFSSLVGCSSGLCCCTATRQWRLREKREKRTRLLKLSYGRGISTGW